MKKILATSIVLATLGGTLHAATTNTENGSSSVSSALGNKATEAQKDGMITLQKVVKKAWLGVSLSPVPDALSKHLEKMISQNQGVMVQSVEPDSPASKAGLKGYDILLSFNNVSKGQQAKEQQLFSGQQLAGLIVSSNEGDEVIFNIVRNGIKETITAKLGGKQPVEDVLKMPKPLFSHPDFLHSFQPPMGFPKMPAMPQSKAQASVMQQFESISINSLLDDSFRAKVVYQENGREKKEFIFEGKYDEIRKQITDSKELPESKKNSLLNALKNNPNQLMPDNLMSFPQMPAFPAMPSFDSFFNQRQQQIPSRFNNGSKF